LNIIRNTDKRNHGAKEIEKMVVMAIENNNDNSIKKYIELFKTKLINS
jgi:hypothetical protein